MFDERRIEVEAELAPAISAAEAAKAEHVEAFTETATLRELEERVRAEVMTARAEAQRERDAKDAALRTAIAGSLLNSANRSLDSTRSATPTSSNCINSLRRWLRRRPARRRAGSGD